MKTYHNYKPTNIQWIGEIPEHWEVVKLKYLTSIIVDGTHFTPTYEDSGIPFLRVTDIHNDVIDFDKIKYISEDEHIELTKRCKPQKGDVLLSKNGTIGLTKVVDWDWEFSVFVSLCVIRFKSKFHPELFSYTFQSNVVDQQLSEGSKQSTVTNLHLEKIRELFFLTPPFSEQEAIVSFLDEKTALIDELIEKKTRKIDLLKEYRTALINNAVTGKIFVNSTSQTTFKPSGIEWIGDIPEHWEVVPLKYLLVSSGDSLKTGPFGSHLKAGDFKEEGVKVYNQRTVYDQNFEAGEVFVSEEKYESLKGFEVFAGEILITSRGTIGRCTIVPNNIHKGIIHPCLIKFQLDKETAYDEFVKKFINESSLFIEEIKLKSNATTIEVIYSDSLKNALFPLPPLSEQKEIVAFLEVKTAEVDKAVDLETQKITQLKEYRQSLISNVVTGKVCVV